MGDRNAAKRCLLPRPVVRLVVVGICLLFRVSTAGQADPKLALIEAIRQAGRESGAAAFLQQIEAADALVPSADMQGYGDVSRPAEQGWLGMDYGDLSLFAEDTWRVPSRLTLGFRYQKRAGARTPGATNTLGRPASRSSE